MKHTMTRQKASEQLTRIQARLYQLMKEQQQLEEEARTLAGFLNIAQHEDKELMEAEQAGQEQPKDAESVQ